MNIIILGPPGSGKGTQAAFLAEKFSLEHIDVGRSLREMAKMDTDLGKEIYEIIYVKKEIVPSRILEEVLRMKLNSLPREKGIVFDGVPRTIEQAEYFDGMLLAMGRKLDRVFFVDISQEEATQRISKRWVCEKCKAVFIMGKDIQTSDEPCSFCEGKIIQRNDDTKEGVEKRYAVFEKETRLVLEVYEKRNILSKINGEQNKEKVLEDILQIVERIENFD